MRLLPLLALSTILASAQQPPRAVTHNNEHPAGKFAGHTLRIDLVAQEAVLRPEAEDGLAVTVPLFGEEGTAPSAPGPMIRVPEGTLLQISVRNALSEAIVVYGLHTRPGDSEQNLVVPPATTVRTEFTAGLAGSFFYWASIGPTKVDERGGRDGLLNGALIIDEKKPARHAHESIFLIQHMKAKGLPTVAPPLAESELWLVNGKMWPYTRAFATPRGQPLLWRWINASHHRHPMHLHGSYFDVLATGDGEREIAIAPPRRPQVVTYGVDPGQSFSMLWTPQRAGNWLFHCHVLFHTAAGLGAWEKDSLVAFGHDGHQHMSGLVVSNHVQGPPSPRDRHADTKARKLELFIHEQTEHYAAAPPLPEYPKLSVTLQEPGVTEVAATGAASAPALMLTRGQPVAITVHNQTQASTSIHWHGIELESFYDGVVGFSGDQRRTAPEIPAGGSFLVRFTPPRAGTFIYHTHLNDFQQLSTGLYGALIVLPPGAKFDADHDRIFVLGRDGPDDLNAQFLLNGSTHPPPMQFRAGQSYRLRFINITTANWRRVALWQGTRLVRWQRQAKDGRELETSLRTIEDANFIIDAGETHDFIFTPDEAAELRLVIGHPKHPSKFEFAQSFIVSP